MITPKVNLEEIERLKAAEAVYRSLFENALEGIYQSTPDGRYLMVNTALARMYGYQRPEELLNQVSDITNQIYVDATFRERFKQEIEQQGFVRELEYQVRRCDGSVIWISESARAVRHPSRIRWTSLVRQIDLVGVGALPIIGLMSFLIGIVIAQQGAVQLRQFGAEIYTVNLTGRLSFRELGILMTAIMFAGRSGSSFAAQIGTMKLTEEVDAMRTIGVSPVEALVLPRVMASVIIMPLLGFYAAVLAIIGGAFISMFSLEIPFFTFLTRIQEVVPTHDLWVGLIKAPVFGAIVAMAGCYQGMQVEGNSEEVGLRTTIAVVQAIFAVIVLDAFFAVFFTELGWG